MLLDIQETSSLIRQGKLLHIAGNQTLLQDLPQGNWIGGTTDYFMSQDGGVVSAEKLFVHELPAKSFIIESYTASEIARLTKDTFSNGYSLIILPFDSDVHREFAKNAASFEDIFLKNVVGWVSGVNLNVPNTYAMSFSGISGKHYPDQAVVLHVELEASQTATLGIINIFHEDPNSPVFEFPERDDPFTVDACLVDGKEVVFSQYLAQQNLNTQLPLIGDYSGIGINASIKEIVGDIVYMYAPLFSGISYRLPRGISDYASDFRSHLEEIGEVTAVFSCNCILNFLYGELEGKQVGAFLGPITFGEVAYQLVNQTLVYLAIS